MAIPAASGLGIGCDEHGSVLEPSGRPSTTIFAIGAPRRASNWESTSAPDISAHARALAREIVP
jgi:uncharacterized NAD(P)/FAD-binding protein YdhS